MLRLKILLHSAADTKVTGKLKGYNTDGMGYWQALTEEGIDFKGMKMDCQTAEGMVSRYIKHDLPLNELEEFLDHVQNCSSCYDELETYFIVHEVTHQLDDDSSDSVLDFKKLLEQDIRKSRRYIRKKKVSWLMFGVSICLLIATIAAILIFVMMETNYIL